AQEYTAIPVSRRLMGDVSTPVSLFLKLRESGEYPFLLESVEGGEQLARYSFLGRNPYQVLHFKDNAVTLKKDGNIRKELDQNYFDALEELTTAYREPNLPALPRFTWRSEERRVGQ